MKVNLRRLLGKLPKPPANARMYTELLKSEPMKEDEMYKGDPSETVAALLFTGVTTGKPKAVMLSHLNIMANIIYQRLWFHRNEAKDNVLALLPFFHAYGFGSILGLSLHIAANLVLQIRYDPKEFIDAIVKYKISLVPAAPTIYINLLKTMPEHELSRIKEKAEICFSGAAPLPVEIMKR